MPQVLKDEIRINILHAALAEFYEKGFLRATMRSIAARAGVPAGLIYSYYSNKEALFDEVLRPVLYDWEKVFTADSRHDKGVGFKRLSENERKCIVNLLRHRQEFLILIDKSEKTKYEREKENLIQQIEDHLNIHKEQIADYDPVYVHIIASNFVDGMLQVMYHYKGEKWAMEILDKLIKLYLQGIDF